MWYKFSSICVRFLFSTGFVCTTKKDGDKKYILFQKQRLTINKTNCFCFWNVWNHEPSVVAFHAVQPHWFCHRGHGGHEPSGQAPDFTSSFLPSTGHHVLKLRNVLPILQDACPSETDYLMYEYKSWRPDYVDYCS